MIHLVAQPRIPYYAWQIEVQLYQHKKLGLDLSKFHYLCAYSFQQNDLTNRQDVVHLFQRLEKQYPEAKFFYYQDTRNPITYIPSIIPHLYKKHYALNKWLEKETVFCCDCDMIFTKVPDFSELTKDRVCYMSDSRNFINYDYINYNRPPDLYDGMCEIVGIDPQIPKQMNNKSGGSQYIMKFGSYDFWEKVERDSNSLFKFFQDTEPERYKRIPNYYGIQQFTSSMWAWLWNTWVWGYDTDITKKLDFCWGSDGIERWNQTSIFHNAGVTKETSTTHRLFYKANYINRLPYDDVLMTTFNSAYASSKYAELIKEVAETSVIKNMI